MSHFDHTEPIYRSRGEPRHESTRQRQRVALRAHLDELSHPDADFESTGTFLEPEEILSLTDRTRRHAQVKVLRSMGIEHKVRPDGGIAVLRAHITKVFDGHPDATSRARQTVSGPNWKAI